MICFDTTPLIWGLQTEGPDPITQHNIDRTKAYLQQLAEQKEQIIIPTPVLAEYLVKIPYSEHAEVINQLRDLFKVYPFDERVASFAAHLRTQASFQTAIEQLTHDFALTRESARQIVKVDAMVIAVAFTRGASRLVSEDKGMRSLAEGIIEATPIPHIDRQLKLTEDPTEK
jgi:predicted nucleic acid-binding protein